MNFCNVINILGGCTASYVRIPNGIFTPTAAPVWVRICKNTTPLPLLPSSCFGFWNSLASKQICYRFGISSNKWKTRTVLWKNLKTTLIWKRNKVFKIKVMTERVLSRILFRDVDRYRKWYFFIFVYIYYKAFWKTVCIQIFETAPKQILHLFCFRKAIGKIKKLIKLPISLFK